MILAGLFTLELLLLFVLSRSLTSALAGFFYALTRSRRATIYILAFLFLPGTILHELAHLLVAGMMFVPVGRIEILPEIEGDEVRLGSAEIARTDMLRRTIIGMAPIVVGLLVIMAILWLTSGSISKETSFWQFALVLYVIFEIGNTMFSSKKDMEGALFLLIGLLLVILAGILAVYNFGYLPTLMELVGKNLNFLESFFGKASLFLLVPLGLDIIFLGVTRILNLKTG